MERLAAEEQKGRLELDPWFDLITEYVMTRVSGTWFTPAEILKELGVDKSRRERAHEMRVGNVLRELGCERRRERRGAGGGNTSIVDPRRVWASRRIRCDRQVSEAACPYRPHPFNRRLEENNGRCSTNNAAGGAEWGQWGQCRKKRRPGCDPTAEIATWEIHPMSELNVRAVKSSPVKRSEPRLDRTTFTTSRHKPSRRHFVCLEGVYPGETSARDISAASFGLTFAQMRLMKGV